MDLAIEANRNSALFNTMQQVLDVYNPLVHKARPTTVNETKHRIRVQPTRWGNTFDSWNGRRTARFDMPRIGSLVDASLRVAFRIPGDEASLDAGDYARTGVRGFAKPTLTTGGSLDNTRSTSNTARGRLDRVYADRLLGFNMISTYTVSSKSRQIFRGSGEYLLLRFSQMDEDMKQSIFDSVSPVDIMSSSTEDMFYAPGTTYQMAIPLFMFFNEHITNALDVNFSEEVHIDIEFRAPSELFYYGNLGDLNKVRELVETSTDTAVTAKVGTFQRVGIISGDNEQAGRIAWDQSTTEGARTTINDGSLVEISRQSVSTASIDATGTSTFGTANVAINTANADSFTTGTTATPIDFTGSNYMASLQQKHIQGIAAPIDSPNHVVPGANDHVGASPQYYGNAGYTQGAATFAYPDVDNLGESVQIMFELNADYIVQDTDAYRALRAQTFPEGTGLTTIVYDTSQESFSNLFASTNTSQNLLDARSGGSFIDPDHNSSGITTGDSTRFVDLQLRVNNLCFATHFMVRKHSDMGGDRTTTASKTTTNYGRTVAGASKVLGAHNIYTRALPVHYFQLLAAGRVLYESDGRTQLNLTQSAMYNGTGKDWGTKGSDLQSYVGNNAHDNTRINARPFNIYSINFGLDNSRLENTGCLSYQNLNNPTLRIYFKPETWGEHQVVQNGTDSEAKKAAALGVQVDVIHEHFNVITVNSGNGEITSGLNQ